LTKILFGYCEAKKGCLFRQPLKLGAESAPFIEELIEIGGFSRLIM
jgi:hypothetical protein